MNVGHQEMTMMINIIFFKCLIAPLLIFSSTTEGLSLNNNQSTNRRSVLQKASHFGTAIIGASTPFITTSTFNIANAQTDAQFKDVGQQEAAPAGETPFQTLSSGVQVKDFRVGSGPTVGNGSKVVSSYDLLMLMFRSILFWDRNYCSVCLVGCLVGYIGCGVASDFNA